MANTTNYVIHIFIIHVGKPDKNNIYVVVYEKRKLSHYQQHSIPNEGRNANIRRAQWRDKNIPQDKTHYKTWKCIFYIVSSLSLHYYAPVPVINSNFAVYFFLFTFRFYFFRKLTHPIQPRIVCISSVMLSNGGNSYTQRINHICLTSLLMRASWVREEVFTECQRMMVSVKCEIWQESLGVPSIQLRVFTLDYFQSLSNGERDFLKSRSGALWLSRFFLVAGMPFKGMLFMPNRLSPSPPSPWEFLSWHNKVWNVDNFRPYVTAPRLASLLLWCVVSQGKKGRRELL